MGLNNGGDIKKWLRTDEHLKQCMIHEATARTSQIIRNADAVTIDCMLTLYNVPEFVQTGNQLAQFFISRVFQSGILSRPGKTVVLVFDDERYVPTNKTECHLKRRRQMEKMARVAKPIEELLPHGPVVRDREKTLPTDMKKWTYVIRKCPEFKYAVIEYVIMRISEYVQNLNIDQSKEKFRVFVACPYREPHKRVYETDYMSGCNIELTSTGSPLPPNHPQGEGDVRVKIWSDFIFEHYDTFRAKQQLIISKDLDEFPIYLSTPPVPSTLPPGLDRDACHVRILVGVVPGAQKPGKAKPQSWCPISGQLEFLDVTRLWRTALNNDPVIGTKLALTLIYGGMDYCEGFAGISGHVLASECINNLGALKHKVCRDSSRIKFKLSDVRRYYSDVVGRKKKGKLLKPKSAKDPIHNVNNTLRRGLWSLHYWQSIHGKQPSPEAYRGWMRDTQGRMLPVTHSDQDGTWVGAPDKPICIHHKRECSPDSAKPSS